MVVVLWVSSVLVAVAILLASFRQAFAADVPTMLAVNGPRVLFGAAVGGAFALSGALGRLQGREPVLGGLGLFALSWGGAAGAFGAAQSVGVGAGAWLAAILGGAVGAGLAFTAVRAIDRPARWTNFAAAALIAAGVGAAALVGSYARARSDGIAAGIAWALGDLSGASMQSGALLFAIVVVMAGLATRGLASAADTGETPRVSALGTIALGLGLGAAGPLAFVAALVPMVVRTLSGPVSAPVFVATSTLAGAAAVVAVDGVPRLLVGGYDFPFNVPAAMVAAPVFLVWNRTRLRTVAGHNGRVFEVLEVAMIATLVLVGTALAAVLARVIASAT